MVYFLTNNNIINEKTCLCIVFLDDVRKNRLSAVDFIRITQSPSPSIPIQIPSAGAIGKQPLTPQLKGNQHNTPGTV